MKKLSKILLCLACCLLTAFTGFGCNTNKPTSQPAQINGIKKEDVNPAAYQGLPIVDIFTQNNIYPKDKETYINCSFAISGCENESYNFAVSLKQKYGDNDSVGIRLRGNTTKDLAKKPYRIKFDNKKSLLGLAENKSWVLLADYLDYSDIKNYTGLLLGNTMDNLAFTPSPNHVVLFLNGYYQGLYILCEQIDANAGRVDIKTDITASDTSFPFLVEMGLNSLQEGKVGVDTFAPNYFQPIEIKYPKSDERIPGENDVIFDYIQEYINAVFELLKTDKTTLTVSFADTPVSFEDLVDIDSFIEYWLVNEIMFNSDSMRKSIYMYKSKTGKLQFGPLWDFDTSMSTIFEGEPINTLEPELANRLCIFVSDTTIRHYINNQTSCKKIAEVWQSVKSKVIATINHLQTYRSKITTAASYDAQYWYGLHGPEKFNTHYDYVINFLTARYTYLDYQLTEANLLHLFELD